MTGNIIYEYNFGKDDYVELIIKYNGDLSRISDEIDISIEVLSTSFAIVKVKREDIPRLYDYSEIIYIEYPKQLFLFLESSINDSCIDQNIRNNLDGEGILIGIIDSGLSENISFADNVMYRLDLNTMYDTEHGTMVASIINSIAPRADIAFVSVGRNDYFASDTDIMRGIKFISDSAQGKPFVINISYGTNSGSHDGNSLFEQYIDEVCQNYVCSIVTASGNEANKQHHFSDEIEGQRTIEFNLDNNLSYAEIEIWKNFADDFEYELISPSGRSIGIINSNTIINKANVDNTTVYIIFSEPTPFNIKEQVYIRLTGNQFINSGTWTLKIYPVNIVDGSYNIWSNYAKFLKPDVNTTLTIPSTANRVITVGAYNSNTNTEAVFSGRGFDADGNVKPDIAAPGVNVVVGNVSYSGTSVAAPFVTASAALLMQWGIVNRNDVNMYGQRLKAFLRRGAIRDGEGYPNKYFGYGKLCLENVLGREINALQITGNNYAYSDYYAEIIVPTNSQLINILENNNVKYCNTFRGGYTVIFYERNSLSLVNLFGDVAANTKESLPVLLGLMGADLNDAANITRVQRPPLDLNGNDVIVGFVDTGINYKNPEFLYDNGDNKIYSIWDMTVEDYDDENVCFGRVYNSEEINNQTADTSDPSGHGTNLAIQACGNSGAAPNSTIIAVKLKKAKNYLYQDNFLSSNVEAYSSIDVILGVDYILRQADILKKPVVILLALGTNEGGHDGSSVLERYLADVAGISGIAVVVPTGNEALEAHHTYITIDTDNAYKDVEISVDDNSRGFKLWLWNEILYRTEVEVISPIGETTGRIAVKNNFSYEYKFYQSDSTVSIDYSLPVYQTIDQRTYLKISNPLSGVWRIRVYGNSNTRVHIWLPIAAFLNANVVFNSPDPFYTATIPSTAEKLVVTGGYSISVDGVYDRSGRGPTRRNNLRPFFVSPTNLNTSVSAAIAAGASALIMEWGIIKGNLYYINSITINALIINSTEKIESSNYPSNISGYGLLNLYNVFFKI